ncbi:MAG: peptidylprolyl isomerase [Candidatus Zixiibacteriota bacterium]
MKRVTFILIFGLALVVALGCSKDDKAGDTSGQTGATADSAAPMTRWDSLAAIRYPVRDENNKFVTLVTDYGNMTLELYRDVAPVHADSFVARVQDGFYDNSTFFRVIDNFMIQGGDPTGTGKGKVGYYLAAEFSDLPHQDGTLAMARSSDVNSASTQFYICLARNRQTASLDGKYTVFGQLIKGYDVLHKMGSVEVVANPERGGEVSEPVEEIFLRAAFVSDAEGNEIQ